MKDKLLSVIAHDLKNPIGSILGFSKLIEEAVNEKDCSSALEYNKIVDSTIKRTNELLNNLLQWAQIQTTKITTKLSVVDVRKLSCGVVELLISMAQNKNIKLINHIPEGIIINSDEVILETIIRNIVSNSIKFTRNGGFVEIFTEEMGKDLYIIIKDNGVGIERDKIPLIFNLSNITETGTGGEKGTGLGLPICKDLAEKINAEIKVKSIVGQGTEFLIKIANK